MMNSWDAIDFLLSKDNRKGKLRGVLATDAQMSVDVEKTIMVRCVCLFGRAESWEGSGRRGCDEHGRVLDQL